MWKPILCTVQEVHHAGGKYADNVGALTDPIRDNRQNEMKEREKEKGSEAE
jgi:hypothetical protein